MFHVKHKQVYLTTLENFPKMCYNILCMKKRLFIAFSIPVICILIAVAMVYNYAIKEKTVQFYEPANYQAIFLSNGQVYFGKVAKDSGTWIILEDVYYLQNEKTILDSGTDQNQLKLVKMGSELHGPESKMQINRTLVSFIENLRSDSKVVKAMADLNK